MTFPPDAATPTDSDFDVPDLPTDAIEPMSLEDESPPYFRTGDPLPVDVPREKVAARAHQRWLAGSKDAYANWFAAEREVTRVARRAAELRRMTHADLDACWARAESELSHD